MTPEWRTGRPTVPYVVMGKRPSMRSTTQLLTNTHSKSFYHFSFITQRPKMKASNISLPIFIFLLSSTHCSILAHKNTPFVDKICKQTPYHALCLKTLLSDPRSAGADVRGLAIIMVGVIKRDTVNILSRINELLKKGGTDPHTRGALLACIGKYNAVLKADVPEAMEALEKGDYKFAEQGATDASLEANLCEENFETSPIANMNKMVHHVSLLAASIVRMLL